MKFIRLKNKRLMKKMKDSFRKKKQARKFIHHYMFLG